MSETKLRRLGSARPPPRVRAVILQRALAEVHQPRPAAFPWRAALAGAAVAIAAVATPLLLRAPAGPTTYETAGASQEIALGPHHITLAPHTHAVIGADPRQASIDLAQGLSSFAVAKLSAGDTFRVRTAQVLVEVVGTRFDVEADGSCSTVKVQQGKVRVTPTGAPAVLLVPPQEQTFCGGVGSQVPSEAERLVRDALPLISAGELDRAGDMLGRALALQPGGGVETEAIFHLWVVHSTLGHDAEAERFAHELIAREPGSERAERIRTWLHGR
jgi:ferric-dicitrate binding protein FerR (iron transport regulator)